MTEEEKNEDTRDVDPVAQKLAALCDALGVDPLSDGWLEGCVEAARELANDADEQGGVNADLAAKLEKLQVEAKDQRSARLYAEGQLEKLQGINEKHLKQLDDMTERSREAKKKLARSEEKRVDLDALFGQSQLKLKQAEARVAELDQELRKEREKSDRMRDRRPTEYSINELASMLEANLKRAQVMFEMVRREEREPNPPKQGEMPTLCHICRKPKADCTCQNEVEVPSGEPTLEDRHKTKVGQYESTHVDPIEEAKRAAVRLDGLQKDNRKKLGSLESTVAQGVHDFAKQLKSMTAPTPLDDVAKKLKEHNARHAVRAGAAFGDDSPQTIPDALPEWTDAQDLELRQNLARLKVGTGWSGKGPRANVTDLLEPDEDGGEPDVEYQIDEEVRKRGNELAEKRVLAVTAFFEQFPSCVYLGPTDPMRDRVPGPGW